MTITIEKDTVKILGDIIFFGTISPQSLANTIMCNNKVKMLTALYDLHKSLMGVKEEEA